MNSASKNNLAEPLWVKLFLLMVLFLPFNFALNFSASIDLPLVRLAVVVVFAIYLFWALKEKKFFLDDRLRFWLLILFLMLTTLSFLWATDSFRAGRKIIFLWSFLPVYIMSFALSQNRPWLERMLRILSWSAFLVACFGLIIFSLQFWLGLNPTLNLIGRYLTPFFLGQNFSEAVLAFPSWLVNIGGKNFLRAFGSFPDPHLFALFLNLILPLTFWLAKQTRQKKYWVFLTVTLLATALTFSRAAYFSLIVAGLFFLITSSPNRFFKKHILSFALLGSLLFLLVVLPNPLSQRFFSSFNLSEGSNQGRLLMWQAGWQMTRKHPWRGVGIGNFSRILEPTSQYRDPIYAHNLFLDFSSETGLVNAFILLLVLLSPVAAFWRRSTPANRMLALSLIIFLIHSLFETPVYSIHILPLLLILFSLKTVSLNYEKSPKNR